MNEGDIRKLLEEFKSGAASLDQAIERLRGLPFEDLGFAKIDHHRSLRAGFPEVVYARGKTAKQVAEIVRAMVLANSSHNILVTRASENTFAAVRKVMRSVAGRNCPPAKRTPQAIPVEFHKTSGAILIQRSGHIYGKGLILVVTAGTSDIPVA